MVGILGGMGPAASAAFYTRLTALTPAATDQEHLPVLLWSDSTIPDRSAAVLGMGADPSAHILRGLSLLENAGATLIAVPCNTAHFFLRRLSARVSVPVVDMVRETCRVVRASSPPLRRVGLLGTSGLVSAGLYQRELRATGVGCLTPSNEQQAWVDQAIAHVKARDLDRAGPLLASCARALVEHGCEAIIAGCTEIPLALTAEVGARLIDPGLILAQRCVTIATRQRATGSAS
ncbi:amino acid racemase [Spirillospora sp. NPDC049024]